MSRLKRLVVYMSVSHGNTEKVARAMAYVLSAELKRVDEVEPADPSNYDLIGFGSGIYNNQHHEALLDLVQRLPHSDKKAFIFSTAGYVTGERTQKYHEPLRMALISKGYQIVGEFSCPGLDTAEELRPINEGRPNEQDLSNARDFAESLFSSECKRIDKTIACE